MSPRSKRDPLHPIPLGIELIGRPQRWISCPIASAPLPGEVVQLAPPAHARNLTDLAADIEAVLDDYAVVDTYGYTDPGVGKVVSVGVVRLTANAQRRALRTVAEAGK